MAIEGGADTIQFRQKDGSTRELVESAQAVQVVCAEHGVSLVVNDRADLALAVGAAGAHFGQDDLPIAVGRRILPPKMIIGDSARTEEKILEAISVGADYIGFGPYLSDLLETGCRIAKGAGSPAADVRNRAVSHHCHWWYYG